MERLANMPRRTVFQCALKNAGARRAVSERA